METKQLLVLIAAAMMVLAMTKINVAQLIDALERFGRGGGSPPNHPLPGNDSVILLRRRKKST